MDQMHKVQSVAGPVTGLPVRMELKPERIQELLLRTPAWKLREDGTGIERVRPFVDPARARVFVHNVCRVSSLMRQPVAIEVDARRVVVTLKGHPIRGCTGGLNAAVFKLAEIIG